MTATLQRSPGAKTIPVLHDELTLKAGPVAGCTLTSVNDQEAVPQLLTLQFALVLLPIWILPKLNTSGSMQIRACADAGDGSTMPSSNSSNA